MTRDEIIAIAERFVEESPGNYVCGKAAIKEDYTGMKIFDSPIFAFGAADDEIYTKYKSSDIIGNHFRAPEEWFPGAKTVISFFLPFTERIRRANTANRDWPAEEWLHGRFEGQAFLKEFAAYMHKILSDKGHKSLIPSFDAGFKSGSDTSRFSSNWSERHIAYACGLGTFGLSKGLITEKGICGRFGSILTELDLPKDARPYKEAYDYCTMCGLCIVNCPANAIREDGKDDLLCSAFLDKVLNKHKPRYGCGKCQVGVPCESAIP